MTTALPLNFLEADNHAEAHNRYRPLTICDALNSDIANIYDEDNAAGPKLTRDEAISYAHLFAAAPDLLDALKLMVDRVDWSEVHPSVSAAIAKAEGR